jgi:predicted RNase H-like HicB family nuclease
MIEIAYTAGYKFEPEGVHAEVLDFPGAISCGTNLDDARGMLADALAVMAETFIRDGDPVPRPDPGKTSALMDVIEPIYLTLGATAKPISEPAGTAHETG